MSSSAGSPALELDLDAIAAESGFSGVVRVDRADGVELAKAYGARPPRLRDPQRARHPLRGRERDEGADGAAVVSLIEEGRLELSTTARSLLGGDLPLIDDAVTVEHLLGTARGSATTSTRRKRSNSTTYLLPVPVQELATTEQYLAVLDGFTRRSSRRTSGSRTATAATSCWR